MVPHGWMLPRSLTAQSRTAVEADAKLPCVLCRRPNPTRSIIGTHRKVCADCALDIPLELHVPTPEVTT